MRAALLAILLSGCSSIYDGNDLHGRAGSVKWKITPYPGGNTGLVDVAIGDVDGDGHRDLVALSHDDGQIVVFLGKGDGTFTPGGTARACSAATGVTLTDLDSDGNDDVVVVCFDDQSTPTLSRAVRLMSMGGGQFAAAAMFDPGGVGPSAVDSIDLDHDGHNDLLITHQSSGGLAILYGKGDGTFERATGQATGAGALDLAIGDLNGDGAPDVAVVNSGNSNVSVMLNASGALSPAVNYPTHDQPWSVAIGDFDGKGGPDMAITTFGFRMLDVTLNGGAGAFPQSDPTATDLPFSATRVRTADFNKDGKMDLVVGAFTDGQLALYYGVGDGTFDPPVLLDAGSGAGVAVGDLNNDGRDDIVIADDDSPSHVTVILNHPR